MHLRFDRGTILLSDPPQEVDLSDLRGVLWDERVGALRAPAMLHGAIKAELSRRGVRFSGGTGAPAALPGRWAEPLLRPYQDDAIWAWHRAGQRGVVVLPTGSGKTRLALAAMARAGSPALAFVPTRVLLDQWLREICASYCDPVGYLGDGERRLEAVTVATFESAWRQMERIGDRFGLLVVDEVHHFGDGRRDEALELCTAPSRLGLTATPPRSPSSERLGDLVGSTVFEMSVFTPDNATAYAVAREHLVMPITCDISRVASERRRSSDSGAGSCEPWSRRASSTKASTSPTPTSPSL